MHPLIDLSAQSAFTHAGITGNVHPQFISTSGGYHHSRFFHVEFPAGSRIYHPIDAFRLVAIIGDGGTRRHFKSPDVAKLISGISSRMDLQKLLKQIAF